MNQLKRAMRYIPAMGQRSAIFVCIRSDQNNYTNDLWTHYLIYFIRLSGSFELQDQIISTSLWLGYYNELYLNKRQQIKRSKVIRQRISQSTAHPVGLLFFHALTLKSWKLDFQQELLVTFLLSSSTDGREGCSILKGKWLVVNIDCHCWESKRERNERKQVHLPQVYNPEITVCSGTCLTVLQAACASLLISSAPAVQELIWGFSESITLLSKVSLPERYSHMHMRTCTHGGKKFREKCTHTHKTYSPLCSKQSFAEVNCATFDSPVLNQTLSLFVLPYPVGYRGHYLVSNELWSFS